MIDGILDHLPSYRNREASFPCASRASPDRSRSGRFHLGLETIAPRMVEALDLISQSLTVHEIGGTPAKAGRSQRASSRSRLPPLQLGWRGGQGVRP